MKKNILKIFLVFFIVLLFLFVFVPLIFFSRYNNFELKTKSVRVSSSFNAFLHKNDKIISLLSSDNLIKSSLLQYFIGDDIKIIQNHINNLKDDYDEIVFISLYDRNGKLFLSTDYSKNNKEIYFKKLKNINKKCYEISYFSDFNQYLFISTLPLFNDFNMKVGYMKIAFSLNGFLDTIKISKDFVLFIKQNGLIVFTYPFNFKDVNIDNLQSKEKYIKINNKLYLNHIINELPYNFNLYLLYKFYNSKFNLLIWINIFIFFIIIFLIFYLFILYRHSNKDKYIKKTAEDVLKYSQEALRKVAIVKDSLDDINYKKKVLSEKIDKLKNISINGGSEENEFKLIEPN